MSTDMTDVHFRRTTLKAIAVALGLLRAELSIGAMDWLVTPDEVSRYREDLDAAIWVPKASDGPTIDVIQPTIVDGRVTSPVAIELAFRASPGASIDVESFRAYYGAFKLDVTQRLLKAVTVQANGLRVNRAEIPSGSHRFVLQISDSLQRTSTRDLRFVVS